MDAIDLEVNATADPLTLVCWAYTHEDDVIDATLGTVAQGG